MSGFDETLEEYQKRRVELRGLQGDIQKRKNHIADENKELEKEVKKYNNCRAKLIDAQERLKPLLDAEVASHPILEREKLNKGERVVEKIQSPRPGLARPSVPPGTDPETPPEPGAVKLQPLPPGAVLKQPETPPPVAEDEQEAETVAPGAK